MYILYPEKISGSVVARRFDRLALPDDFASRDFVHRNWTLASIVYNFLLPRMNEASFEGMANRMGELPVYGEGDALGTDFALVSYVQEGHDADRELGALIAEQLCEAMPSMAWGILVAMITVQPDFRG